MRNKYYSLKHILAKNAHYNFIFGERSNGKTTAVLEYALSLYKQNNKSQLAIIRRWSDDFKGKRAKNVFSWFVDKNKINYYTNGLWQGIEFSASAWYFTRYDDELKKAIRSNEPFAFAFALSGSEHEKMISYPNIDTILFDEVLTRSAYLPDEFMSFMSIVSTITRDRNNIKIFMLGNTVNKYSPYFSEMGLTNVKNMKQGDIDVYAYGDSDLRVAVEWADSCSNGKDSDLYFAFNNPKLNMIKTGAWEISIYPHKPMNFNNSDIIFKYFIEYENDVLQCEIIQKDNIMFTYIHRKTTPIKNDLTDIVYSPIHKPQPNYKRKITTPTNKLEKKIALFFVKDKVFYQSNEIGEIVRNYLQFCKSDYMK